VKRWLLAALLCLSLGCQFGRQRPWTENARIAINTAAHVVVVLDGVAADAFEHRYVTVRTDAELQALFIQFAPVATSLSMASAHLRQAEALVLEAERTGQVEARCVAAVSMRALASDLTDLNQLFLTVGVEVPPSVLPTVSALAQVGASVAGCNR
jgi:hypothetical protein